MHTTGRVDSAMDYKIRFQYKQPHADRPDEESLSEYDLTHVPGDFMAIPAPGDTVILFNGRGMSPFKVLTRNFTYAGEGYCYITIVVGDVSNDEMLSRVKPY